MTQSQQPLCRDAMLQVVCKPRPRTSNDVAETCVLDLPWLCLTPRGFEGIAGGRVLGTGKFLLEIDRCGLSRKNRACLIV